MRPKHLLSIVSLMLVACGGGIPTEEEDHVENRARRPRAISESGHGAFEAALAPMKDGAAVVWQDSRHGDAEIYYRLVGRSGQPLGPEHRLTRDDVPSYAAQVAGLEVEVPGGVERSIVVGWYEPVGPTARLGAWGTNGKLHWHIALAQNGRNPVVVTHEDRIFSAWLQTGPAGDTEVWAGWWDRTGTRLTDQRVVGAASATTWNLNAAIDEAGSAYVVWDAAVETQADEIWVARLSRDGETLHRVTSDDGFSSRYPDLSLAGDRAALTWFDKRDGNEEIYLRVGSLLDVLNGAAAGARRITNTPGESIGAYVAWNAGRFGLTWCDDSSGSYEVFFQSFNEAGDALEPAQQLTHTAAHSLIPAIEPWESGFALVWNELEITDEPPHSPGAKAEIHFLHIP